jgi:hypothetical protein
VAAVMIGIDPQKASHTAVAIGVAEEPLGELRVRASAPRQSDCWPGQRLGHSGPGRSRGASGLGYLLAQQRQNLPGQQRGKLTEHPGALLARDHAPGRIKCIKLAGGAQRRAQHCLPVWPSEPGAHRD